MKRTSFDTDSDFAAMYEKSLAGIGSFQPGQLVKTQVLSISKDTIFLQLNGKSEGVLSRDEMTDKDGQLTVEVGDSLKVYFLRADNGEMLFTTMLSGESAGSDLLEKAYQDGIPVEGLVEKEIKGGYQIKIGETRAFCPYSQMGQQGPSKPDYVGKQLIFKIQEFKENGRNILVSNRAIHEEARQAGLETLKKTLQEGMVIKGQIKSIQGFGAFVDVGGIQALLPISEIGRSRVEDIHKVLTVGQEIEASILKIDWKNEKITLSMKSLLTDPWEQAAEKYLEGSKHTGKVVRIADFGAFVSLEPGLDGLIHVSEFRSSSKFGGNQVTVKLGQTVSVQILGVDGTSRRISLKPTMSAEEDQTSAKYSDDSGGTTYNPFAGMLKKKK